MNEAIATIMSLTDPGLVSWIPVIIALGVVLKKLTPLNNKLIPIALLVLSILVSFLNGLGLGGRTWIGLIGYSIGQGLAIVTLSVFIYDLVKGLWVFTQEQIQKASENKTAETTTESEGETK